MGFATKQSRFIVSTPGSTAVGAVTALISQMDWNHWLNSVLMSISAKLYSDKTYIHTYTSQPRLEVQQFTHPACSFW